MLLTIAIIVVSFVTNTIKMVYVDVDVDVDDVVSIQVVFRFIDLAYFFYFALVIEHDVDKFEPAKCELV